MPLQMLSSRMRYVLRTLAVGGAGVCVVAAAVLLALHSQTGHDLLVRRLNAYLAARQIDLQIGDLRYNLLTLSFDVRDLRIRSTDRSRASLNATIAHLQVDGSLTQLFRGGVVVDSARAEGVTLDYVENAAARDTRRSAIGDRIEPRTTADFLIKTLSVADASVHYLNRAQQIDVVLPVSSLQVAGNAATRRHRVRFAIARGTVEGARHRVAIDRITAALDVGRDDLRVDRLELEAIGSRAEITGLVRRFDAPELALTIRARLDAARAASLLDVREPLAGAITVDAAAGGPLSAPSIDAHVAGTDVRVRSLAATAVELRGTYNAATKSADISSARLDASWGHLAATARLAIADPGRSQLRAEFRAVEAETLMRGLSLPGVAATRVDGTLDITWPGLDYRNVSGRGAAAFTPTPTKQSGGAPLALSGGISLRATAGTIIADLQPTTAAGAQLTGRLVVDTADHIQGELHARVSEIARAANAVQTILGHDTELAPKQDVAGDLAIDGIVSGTVGTPILNARIAAPSLSIGIVSGVALDGELRVTPTLLTVARAEASWAGARTHASGTIGLTGRKPIDLVVDAAAADLHNLPRALARTDIALSGALDAHVVVHGSVARPLAKLTISGTGITAFRELFGALDAEVTLDGRDLSLVRLEIDKPQPDISGRITATGSYNLSRTSYTLDLRSENVRLLGLTLPHGQEIRGNLELSANAAGSVRSPAGTAAAAFDSLEVVWPRARADDRDGAALPPSQLGRVQITANASNEQAIVHASAERYNVDADATVALFRPWPAAITVRANDLDLAKLPFDVGGSLEGRMRAVVRADGDLLQPARGRANVAIGSLAGTWNGQPFMLTTTDGLRIEHQRLNANGVQLNVRGSSLAIKGEWPLSTTAGAGDLAIDAHGHLATVLRLLRPDAQLTADGAATVTGTVRGTTASIEPDVMVTIENGALAGRASGPGVSAVQARTRLADGAIALEQLTGRWGRASIDASATIPLELLPPWPIGIVRRGGSGAIKASIRDFDPAAIPGAPAGLTGRVSLEVEASAARADAGAIEGRITFQELEVALNRLTLAQQQPSRVRIGSGLATVEHLALAGSAGTVAATGTLELAGRRALEVNVDGTLQTGVLSALTAKVRSDGVAKWTLAARGDVRSPQLTGAIDLDDVTIASDSLRLAAVDVNAHVDLSGRDLHMTRLAGEINGGTLEGSGRVTFGSGRISDVDLQLTASDVAYDAPLNLRSLSDSTFRLSRRGDEFLLAGQVTIKDAGLTSNIDFDDELFAGASGGRILDLTQQRDPFLDRVRFNVGMRTATPALVDNRLARGEVDADLRLVGSPYEPGLTGRLTLLPGGQVTLNARRYEVERGLVTFVEQRRIVPSLDLALNTRASNYDLRITVAGSPGNTQTSWTSEPPLPEPDIMALLVTGRTLDQMRGQESEVARVQALSYLTGRVGSRFGGGIERATGISEVRIEPVLVANETDPTARLTIGQNLTRKAKLIYSTNLADSNDQIWIVEYNLTRRFQMRGVREHDDDSYRADFRHDVRFGGDPEPTRGTRRPAVIASLTVVAEPAGDEAMLRGLFTLKKGDRYTYFEARGGLERIEQRLLESGYLQGRVRLDRRVDNDQAHLTLRATNGPPVDLRFDGAAPPSDVVREVRAAWHRGVFDKQRTDDSIQALRRWLIAAQHLQPVVDCTLTDLGGRRQAVFRIQPGPHSDTVSVVFDGAAGIDSDRLDRIVEHEHLERQLFTEPGTVTNLLERFYREQGYLSVAIDAPRVEFHGTSARVVLTIREGRRFAIQHVTVAGNTAYTAAEVIAAISVAAGTPFLARGAEHSLAQIRELYWRKGYNDMLAEYAVTVDRVAATVDVAFTIVEGRQSVIAAIAIDGNRRTREQFVRAQVELAPGQPLDLGALARSRRNLYNTGAFAVADLARDDAGDHAAAATAIGPAAGAEEDERHKPVRVNVSVREVQPVQLRYGLSYDTDGGLGGIIDLSLHNLLGNARVAGVQARYDDVVRDARVYVSQPSLRHWRRKRTIAAYIREDLNPPTEQTDPFDISRKGVSIQQDVPFRKTWVWSYGYRYELATTLEPSLGVGATETVRLTPAGFTLTRETRDEVLDASKGSFLSQAFAYSPGWFGSDRPYLKYYGQYFRYFPLLAPQRQTETPQTGNVRSRLVFATGVRIGLARGLGGEVPTSEHFYAGGSTTLRGFEQNTVGPIANDVPAGGNAVLVLNNELRTPLVRFLDGVLFVDVGNVFATVSDFSLGNLRESAGAGLRLRTPWVLVRTDYGIVLDPRSGEPRSRWHFSIGQAF